MQYEKLYNNLQLLETQNSIKNDNKHKAGIYMIKNNVNQKKYIGSAVTNRINVKFRNHMLHNTGSRLIGAAVAKYGIENFSFYIIEYFPEFVKSGHMGILLSEIGYDSIIRLQAGGLKSAELAMRNEEQYNNFILLEKLNNKE